MPLPHYLSQLLKAVAQGFDQGMHIPSSGAYLVLIVCLQSNGRAGPYLHSHNGHTKATGGREVKAAELQQGWLM